MLKLIILFGILALTAAASTSGRYYKTETEAGAGAGAEAEKEKEPIAILKSEEHRKNDGSYTYAYESADGIFRQETGNVVNPGTEDEGIEVVGSYRYYDADGQLIEVRYTAGKNGFVPIGTNIPVEISLAAQTPQKTET